jgi:hypothetical protein
MYPACCWGGKTSIAKRRPSKVGDVADDTQLNLAGVLNGVLGASPTCDFGDDWEHELVIDGTKSATDGRRYPMCVARQRIAAMYGASEIPGRYSRLKNGLNGWTENFDPRSSPSKLSTPGSLLGNALCTRLNDRLPVESGADNRRRYTPERRVRRSIPTTSSLDDKRKVGQKKSLDYIPNRNISNLRESSFSENPNFSLQAKAVNQR